MFYRRFSSSLAALALALTLGSAAFATGAKEIPADKNNKTQRSAVVSEPLNLAVLVQDDLVSQVGNELGRNARIYSFAAQGSRCDGWLHHQPEPCRCGSPSPRIWTRRRARCACRAPALGFAVTTLTLK